MKEYLIKIAITTLLTALSESTLHADLKRPMLKVFRSIWTVYSQEPEFQQAVAPPESHL